MGAVSFFVENFMSVFPLIFSLWAFASLTLALLWYIVQLQNQIQEEREKNREEREEIRADAESERKNLYDRLMAGTLPQYKEHEPEPNEVIEEQDDLVSLDEAKDDLMGVDNG